MRFLLTSAGIKNASIRGALVDLLGKPIAESNALCIPTAAYGHPMVGPGAGPWRFISGQDDRLPMCGLGWKSLGVLELTALPRSMKNVGCPWSDRLTSCWWQAAMPCTCATGRGNRG
jgi:dipeptidase E